MNILNSETLADGYFISLKIQFLLTLIIFLKVLGDCTLMQWILKIEKLMAPELPYHKFFHRVSAQIWIGTINYHIPHNVAGVETCIYVQCTSNIPVMLRESCQLTLIIVNKMWTNMRFFSAVGCKNLLSFLHLITDTKNKIC